MKRISLSTTPLDVVGYNGVVMSKATGFFYESESRELFLVTNWHVVTGRNPENPKLSDKGAVPRALRLKLHARLPEENAVRLSQLKQLEISINSEDGNAPEWREHPVHRHEVDVVAIKIEDRVTLEKECVFHVLNRDDSFETRYVHEVMDDVFVIGYPWGLSGSGGALPIFKRGSIASEPAISYRGLPRFLIDCRTSPAMSGSPVLVEHSGLWNPGGGAMTDDSVIGTLLNFVGVYSGRLVNGDQTAIKEDEISEIGIVWKQQALDEVVNHGVTGTKLDEIIQLAS